MPDDARIDSSHLTGKFLQRFKKIEVNVLSSYQRALGALKDNGMLPYIPVVRVTPFVVVRLRVMSGTKYRQTSYAFTTLDTENFDRFAIYPSLDLLEKFPNYVAAGLGHEIGHVIAFGGKLSVTKKKFAEQLFTPLKAEKSKEVEMENALRSFNDEFRKEIIEWNGASQNMDFKDFLVERAWTQNQNQFEAHFFGKSRRRLDEYRQTVARKALGI